MRSIIRVYALALCLAASQVFAGVELKPFETNSLAVIKADREGKPFLLMLWSLDCPPCLKELKHLRSQIDNLESGEIVLVSTDGPANWNMAEQTLQDFGLEQLDNWIYADDFGERLRYSIDPGWFGELPRTYFYDDSHQRFARSGVQKVESLLQWLTDNRQ